MERNQQEESFEVPPAFRQERIAGPVSPPSESTGFSVRSQGYRSFPQRRIRAALLFIATIGTTWFAGTLTCGTESFVVDGVLQTRLNWQIGFVYAAAVMGILLCHEMGHYLQARRYGVPATLPYFIPVPPPFIFGTMGAIIVQGAGVANRKSLFDIAISGPLAGLVVAIPVAWMGVREAEILSFQPESGGMVFGDPLLLKWMIRAVHGPLPPGTDVDLSGNPLLFAGWVGLFITGLNLVPIGQLDGGHILYTLIGRKAHWVAGSLLALCGAWMVYTGNFSFFLMILLLLMMGPFHPPTADDHVPLGTTRCILGVLTLLFVIIGLTPTPLTVLSPAG